MVTKRQCSFCAQEIEPGTGTIFVKRDGTVYQFCSSSCRKQQLHLGRLGHRFKWTRAYELKRAAERSTAERGSGAAPVARGTSARAPAPRPSVKPPAAPPAEPREEAAAPPGPEPASAAAPARPKKARAKAAPKEAAKPRAKPPAKAAKPSPDSPSDDA